jgi:hydrogenase 3 maturation protease
MENPKISPYPWQNSLSKLLRNNLANSNGSPRLAIVGIGNELNGDDAAGSLVARALSGRKCDGGVYRLLTIDAGVAPENITGDLRTFKPDLIVFIDAADMGEAPGTVRWIAMDEIDGMSASTHRMPLSMLAQYLTLELGCDIVLLGIQPASVEMGKALSDPVRRLVKHMSDDLCDLLMLNTGVKGIFVNEPVLKTLPLGASD